jgi:hypothetical protein
VEENEKAASLKEGLLRSAIHDPRSTIPLIQGFDNGRMLV